MNWWHFELVEIHNFAVTRLKIGKLIYHNTSLSNLPNMYIPFFQNPSYCTSRKAWSRTENRDRSCSPFVSEEEECLSEQESVCSPGLTSSDWKVTTLVSFTTALTPRWDFSVVSVFGDGKPCLAQRLQFHPHFSVFYILTELFWLPCPGSLQAACLLTG